MKKNMLILIIAVLILGLMGLTIIALFDPVSYNTFKQRFNSPDGMVKVDGDGCWCDGVEGTITLSFSVTVTG